MKEVKIEVISWGKGMTGKKYRESICMLKISCLSSGLWLHTSICIVNNREACHAAVHGVAKTQTRHSNWTTTSYILEIYALTMCWLYYNKKFFKKVSQSLTPFINVWLLTAFKPHPFLFTFCPTSRQAEKKAWVFPTDGCWWKVQILQAPYSSMGIFSLALAPNHHNEPKPVFFLGCLKPFLDLFEIFPDVTSVSWCK